MKLEFVLAFGRDISLLGSGILFITKELETEAELILGLLSFLCEGLLLVASTCQYLAKDLF
jgi:hypothetical protein